MTAPYPIPDEVLVHHAAFLGKTRSGKTSSAKTAVERFVAAGERVCVLDPIKSDWWGMISSADGKAPGLPFQILGGPHGHVPLPSSSGKVIGELVGTGALPLSIVDMADFEAGGLQRFFCAFAEALMRRQRGVLHLVIEEAHEFAPKERAGIGDENLAIHWAKKLATAGGSKGIRLIVATQRTQALHNALLGSCETMVAHRITAPADQEPVIKWLKANAPRDIASTVTAEMGNLRTGTAWLCSGEARLFERVEFPRIATFDNSATPLTDDQAQQVRTAAVDVSALRQMVGEAVAEAEANDPKKLKAEITRLMRENSVLTLARQRAAAPDPAMIKAAQDAFLRGVEDGEGRGNVAGQALMLTRVRSALDGLGVDHAAQAPQKPQEAPRRPAATVAAPRPAPATQPSPARAERANGADTAPEVPPGCAKPLASLAGVYPAGMTESQWATAAGYKRTGGTWGAYKSRLRSAGLIEQREGRWFATETGADAAVDVELPPAPGPDLVRWWASRLPGTTKVAEALIEAWPRDMAREELAAAVNMSAAGGSFGAYLSRLASLGLIERDGGFIRLSAEAMGPQ